MTALRKAAEIDPLSSRIWNTLGRVYDAAGEIHLAREALTRSLQIAPESFSGPYHLGTTYLLERQPAAALAVFERAVPVFRMIGSAMAQHDLGHAKESQLALDAATARYGHIAAFQIAETYAWRGETDQAFEWLERAYLQRDGGLPLVKYSPLLRSLRGDPRYPALLRRLNLPAD